MAIKETVEEKIEPCVYVLRKNFAHGAWLHFAAGMEFVAGKDDATISLLARHGAKIELKEAEKAKPSKPAKE